MLPGVHADIRLIFCRALKGFVAASDFFFGSCYGMLSSLPIRYNKVLVYSLLWFGFHLLQIVHLSHVVKRLPFPSPFKVIKCKRVESHYVYLLKNLGKAPYHPNTCPMPCSHTDSHLVPRL